MRDSLRKISVHKPLFSEVRLAVLRPFFNFATETSAQGPKTLDNTQGLGLHKRRFLPKFSPLKKISRRWIFIFLIVILAIIIIVAARSISGQSTKILPISQTKTSYIGKSFQFSVTDADGKPTDLSLAMNLTNAELTKKILIQGQPATARDTKIFLILNLEISNAGKQQLKISPVNLIRLIDSSGKLFAPDVHNDEVTIEPISTKKTRVGFVVDEGTSNFKIQVGEVNGQKELINVKF